MFMMHNVESRGVKESVFAVYDEEGMRHMPSSWLLAGRRRRGHSSLLSRAHAICFGTGSRVTFLEVDGLKLAFSSYIIIQAREAHITARAKEEASLLRFARVDWTRWWQRHYWREGPDVEAAWLMRSSSLLIDPVRLEPPHPYITARTFGHRRDVRDTNDWRDGEAYWLPLVERSTAVSVAAIRMSEAVAVTRAGFSLYTTPFERLVAIARDRAPSELVGLLPVSYIENVREPVKAWEPELVKWP